VGNEVAKNKLDILITVGKEAKNIAKQAVENGMNKENVYELENIEEAIKIIKEKEKTGDAILVKASNGMNFKKIVEEIKN
jgi:UDP-N-acetylmuramyl pentapeptide synthase